MKAGIKRVFLIGKFSLIYGLFSPSRSISTADAKHRRIYKSNKPVRFVDAFVERLELPKLGFIVSELKKEGRPAFNPKVFLKLYLYGYLNGVRSSRKLEKETIRNVEVHWFLGNLSPKIIALSILEK